MNNSRSSRARDLFRELSNSRQKKSTSTTLSNLLSRLSCRSPLVLEIKPTSIISQRSTGATDYQLQRRLAEAELKFKYATSAAEDKSKVISKVNKYAKLIHDNRELNELRCKNNSEEFRLSTRFNQIKD